MEAQDRYSRELLDCVEYLLTVRDPEGETAYFSGLHRLSPHPSETVAIIRNNASVVVGNHELHEFGPCTHEDLLFLEIEGRIQDHRLLRHTQSVRRAMSELGLVALAGGVALGGIVFGEGFSTAVIGIAGFFAVIGVVQWANAAWQARRPRRSVASIARTLRSIRLELGD